MSFTGRLRNLAACVSPLPTPPAVLSEISTPWNWLAWENMLHTHPEREFADIIVNCIREWFHIGFEYRRFGGTRSSDRNMRSTLEHPDVVDEYLVEERRRGHVLGPFAQLPACPLIVSRFRVIPKRGRENKWWLIVDLSSREGHSVNDGIDPQSCSLSYITLDDIAARIRKLGRCSLIAKCDIKHAYQQVPVHLQDHILLGMRWRNKYYVDTRLPFGLRSAPLLFSSATEALEWAVRESGFDHVFHYIDDFVWVGPPGSEDCERGLRCLQEVCSNTGVILASEKTEGPTMRLTVLGIKFDTQAMMMRLPDEKLQRLQALLDTRHGRGSGSRGDLESLVGILQ